MKALLALLLIMPPPVTAPDWVTCGTAECTTLTVPVDWSRPNGETVGIPVARRAAPDPAKRIGTLVFLPGGPWDSGVQRVRDGYRRFSDTLLDRFDIVSLDPRGSRCEPGPPPLLTSQADFDAALAHNRALWQTCAGGVWRHADMLSNVRDLEALRIALGERQLSFHGSSYGTLLGQQYAERYPGRVRAMVLESVVDHSPAPFLPTQAAAYEDAFDHFADWCAADTSCALHGRDVRQVWRGLRDFDLVAVTLKFLRDAAYGPLAGYLRDVAGGAPPIRVPSLGVVTPAFCADWSLPVADFADYQRQLRQAARVAPDTGYPAQVFALTMCLGWGKVANPQRPVRVRTEIPLLLVNSRHDPATGWEGARNVERQLGRHGVLVTYEGAGHGAYTLSDCIKRTVDDYLVSRTVPARGTTC
ncbi:alpha/beta hydrolase [Paractinoplanes rishiriensis]|uniref:Peptidase n=1 Tax=Paractinoplanes rishiriensis TaxID=1050105 RepID=A0A919JY40_9ACTN|nr:alpha/beta hydrolase [Actinoplanes rishiriensis]GIE93086.1 peptidase [Actinoplanes rishiriensis]